MEYDPVDPPGEVLAFLSERHLATLTVQRADGTPQVTPVGVTYEPRRCVARVITWSAAYKARAVADRPRQRVAVCQVDGGRWLTLYGRATVTADPDRVAEGVERYSRRYRPPKERDDRVVIEIEVDRLVGRA